MSLRGNQEKSERPDIKQICLQTHVYVNGNEVLNPETSQGLRQTLYDVILSTVPFGSVLDEGYNPEDTEKLNELITQGQYKEAAVVKMKNPNIVVDKELMKEVKGYLERAGYPIKGLLDKNEHALLAILTFGYAFTQQYKPTEKKRNLIDDPLLGIKLFGGEEEKKEEEPEETDPIKAIFQKSKK